MLPKMPKRELPGTFAQQSNEPVDWRVSGAEYIMKYHTGWLLKSIGLGFLFGVLAWFLCPIFLNVGMYRLISVPVCLGYLIGTFSEKVVEYNEDVSLASVRKIFRFLTLLGGIVCICAAGFGMGMLPVVLVFAFS